MVIWLQKVEDLLEVFKSQVEEMLDRRVYFRDMWEEIKEVGK